MTLKLNKFSKSLIWANRLVKKLVAVAKNPIANIEIFTILIMAISGVALACLIPPMQGGDEPQHFLRAYQITDGRVLSEYVENSVGGILPTGIVDLSRQGYAFVTPGDQTSKISLDKLRRLYRIQTGDRRATVKFSNTAVYSPVAYVPQAIGIGLGRLLGLRPVLLFYAGRFAGLAVSLAIMYLALRLMPFGKPVMAIFMAIPMTVSQISIVTADAMSLSLCFLAVGLYLNIAYNKSKPTLKQLIFAGLVSLLLSLTKPSLFPLSLLSIGILQQVKLSNKGRYATVGLMIFIAVMGAFGWNSLVKTRAVNGYQADFAGSNYTKQLDFIIHAPLQFMRVLYESFFTTRFNDIPQSFFGKFGWLDAPMPLLFIIIGYIVIGIVVYLNTNYESVKLSRALRWSGYGAALLVIIITAVSDYLFASQLKWQWVFGMQGRYFIVSVMILCLCAGTWRHSGLRAKHYQATMNRLFWAMGCLLLVSGLSILGRYYSIRSPHWFRQPEAYISSAYRAS